MNEQLDTMLRPVVRKPESWFVCAFELSSLVPELGERLRNAFAASQRDPSSYPKGLMGLARAFYLLAGYAAENFIKGIWVRQHREDTVYVPGSSAPFLPQTLSNHKLSVLATHAGVELNSEERATLDFLEMAVTWYARYPFPKAPSEFSLFGVESGEVERVLVLLEVLGQHAGVSATA